MNTAQPSDTPPPPPLTTEARARILTARGRAIILADYSFLNASVHKQLLLATIRQVHELIHADNTRKLVLSDVSGGHADLEALAALKELARAANAASRIDRECVVGLAPLHRHLLEIINVFGRAKIVPFKTREQAIDYLCGE